MSGEVNMIPTLKDIKGGQSKDIVRGGPVKMNYPVIYTPKSKMSLWSLNRDRKSLMYRTPHFSAITKDILSLILLPSQMLVVFKSAPILKRTLKVKHAMLQVHTTMTHFMVHLHLNSFFSSCMFWNCWRCRPSTLADSGGNQTWKQWAPFIQRFLQLQWT